jgi:uncharacterized GH25 family protein/ketosteroid isomerase-like protein
MFMRRAAMLTVLLTCAAGVGSASAHDFWLIPDAFQIASGGSVRMRGQTGTHFPESESAVPIDRIADARILSAEGDERITDFTISGKSLLIAHRPSGAGERVIALSLQVRTQRQSAAGFRRYLTLEGAPDVVARYARDGTFPADSVTTHTAKYAKTIVQVGSGGPTAFRRAAGHALEFMPQEDFSALHPGDTAHVRVLFRGKPLAHPLVHSGRATIAEGDAPEADMATMGNDDGIVAIPLSGPGLWNLTIGFAAPVPGPEPAEWEVAWATFVFRVEKLPARSGESAATSGTAATSDSVAVARVVAAFHAAIGRADSATALAALAADVSIMESGDVEHLSDYRAHHLTADIAFARAVPSTTSPLEVKVAGDAAWVSSTSITVGSFNGRAVNSTGAELMVLSKDPAGRWRIRALHRSSRRR